jgi:F0F1-type ATP synthase membrane subunit b/b'
MRTIITLERLSFSLINLAIFIVMLAAFIMVFFYPETMGAIVGKITKGFREGLQ